MQSQLIHQIMQSSKDSQQYIHDKSNIEFKINISLNMNSNLMLQNYIESGGIQGEIQRPKKSAKGANYQLELLIGTTFNEVCQLFEQHNLQIQIPQDIVRVADKISLFKYFIEQLIANQSDQSHQQKLNDSTAITCKDCQNYQASLQKLQNEVRQHIRLQQQLKIFQDSMQEKIDENKKEKKELQKRMQNYKKQLDETKGQNQPMIEKIAKLEAQNSHLKNQLKQAKRSLTANISQADPLPSRRQTKEPRESREPREVKERGGFGYESKENKIDWVHRNVSIKKEEKQKQIDRKSIERRNDSAQKWRPSVNNKSSKMISIMNEKMIQQKSKEQRKKAIQSKFQYRR